MRPDNRTEPEEFRRWRADEYERWSKSFRSGQITESVYRATLLALGWHPSDIATEVSLNAPERRHWYDQRLLSKAP